MQDFATDREQAAHDLAERMFFKLEKHGDRFLLCRKTGGLTPQRHLLRRPQFKELRAGSFRTWAGASATA